MPELAEQFAGTAGVSGVDLTVNYEGVADRIRFAGNEAGEIRAVHLRLFLQVWILGGEL